MAAINFPTSAVNGTIFYDDFGRKWTYDGSSWSPDNVIPDAGITTSGLVNYSSQTFGGNKTFANSVIVNGSLSLPNTPLSVSNGGTGRSTLTTRALLVGNGTSAVNLITGNSSGILVLNSSSSPALVQMTGDVTINSSGTTAIGASKVTNSMLQNSTFVINSTTISLGQTNALITANTAFGLIKGNGLSYSTGTSFNGSAEISVSIDTTVVATLSDSQILTNKTIDGSSNTLTVRLNDDTSGTLNVSKGGTGLSSISANSILIGNGTSALSTTSGTDSQILLINSSSVPYFATLTGDITINSFGTTAIGASKVTNAMLQNSSFVINSTTINLGQTNAVITSNTPFGLIKGSGLSYSTGTSFNGSVEITVSVDTSVVATLSDSQILTNKTIDGTTNTLTVRLDEDTSGTLTVSKGGTGLSSVSANSILIGNGTSALSTTSGQTSTILLVNSSLVPTFVSLSGDITVNSSGTTAIGNSVVTNAMLQNSSFVLNSTTVNLGQTNAVITSNTPFGLIKGNGISYSTGTSFNGSVEVNVSVDTSVVATLSDSQILTNKTIDGTTNTLIVRLDEDTSGTLTVSKGGTGLSSISANSILIGNGTSALSTTSGQTSTILLVNSSLVPTFVSLTGDVTINSSGTTAIGASKVTNAMLQNSSFQINSTTISLGSTGIVITASSGSNVLSAGTGLSFSTGTTFNGSTSRTIRIDSTVVTLDGAQTLTNKNISGTSTWTASIIPILYGGTGSNNGSISTTNTLTFSATGTSSNIVLSPGSSGHVDVSTKRIKNVVDPQDPQDAATKKYVDDLSTGLVVKDSARVATTADLSATYNNGTSGVGATLTGSATPISIDNVSLSTTNRILVKDQTNLFENGVYEVTTVGTSSPSTPWVITRTIDADQSADFTEGMFVFVTQGDDNAGTGWVLQTTGTVTIGTTNIQFAQFSGNVTYNGIAPIIVDGTNIELDYPLDIIYGGTGESTASAAFNALSPITSLGDLIYGSGTSTAARLAGNISTTKQFLSQTGNGSLSAAPTWVTLIKNDVGLDQVENTALSTWPGSTSIVIVGTITSGTWNGTAISNSNLENSTISSVSLGSNLFNLSTSAGGGISISGTATSYNGSTSSTISVDTSVVVTLNDSQTLTQKTLTSPIVNSATINTSTINNGTSNNLIHNTSTINNSTIGTTGLIFNGVTSGTSRILAAFTPASNEIRFGTTTGTIVTTGDLASVTNAMLQNSSFVINSTTISLGQTNAVITANTPFNLIRGNGLSYSTGTSYNGSENITVSVDTSIVATLTGSQILTNKTINGTNNTLSVRLIQDTNGTLTVPRGGTGLTSITLNSILIGNGTGTLSTTSGSASQILLVNSSSVPYFATLTGDVTINSSGTTAIGTSKVTNSMLQNSSFVINSTTINLGQTNAVITSNTPFSLIKGNGLSYSTGTSFNGSADTTVSVDTSVVATLTDSQILTNKTINGTNNTLNIRLIEDTNGTLTVPRGGTGLTSITLNSILIGNGTSALSTASGSTSQILLVNSSSVPTFVSLTGDVTINSTGTTAIGTSKVTNAMLQNSSFIINSTTISLGQTNAVITSNTANDLSVGSGLTYAEGTTVTFNGSTARSISIDTSVVTLSAVQNISNKTLSTTNIDYATGLLFNDATSGTSRIIAPATLSNNVLTLSTSTGTLVTTGDTATVTNTMLSGSIENNKLTNSSFTINTISISLGSTATITANTPNALTVGTGLQLNSGTTFNGSAARTISVNTSVVATTSNTIVLTNKTIGASGLNFNGSVSGTTTLVATSTISPNNTLYLSTNTGTILTTGDTGTVTGTIIATSTIVNANIADATIQNSKLLYNSISGIQLGSNLSQLSAGNGLLGTSYNGGAASTFQIDTSIVVDHTSSQTISNKTISTSTLNSPSIGGHVNLLSNSYTSSTTNSGQIIHSISASTYRSVKYQVQMTSGTSYHFVELVLLHDGTNVLISEYGTIYTTSSLSTFDADINGGNLRLLVTPANAITTYKLSAIAINI